ncbi:flagellar hook-basal body complex protein FliE [Desulfosporosinus sp. Sb-LF]|uniref:flagellar hook-basal body complex protein FliE n=1 Tax=Desulfosporosinus sp. Sb-LF TaxID=2560027 RepID=UPI00107F5546|nr:flagellar hook-basal body complex protein FliE [Desulfosporosinus sp. Sb-LF]TGE32611.1 flagellar hook-basal body complex protein FliE [Desulfosporosinus sp. Sb-LF]
MSIPPIAPIMPLGVLSPISSASLETQQSVGSGDGAQKAGTDFSKFLNDALHQVDALQSKADVASLELATGQVQDMSSVMVALEKASLSMSLTVSVRDKVLDAYNQIMRMQM